MLSATSRLAFARALRKAVVVKGVDMTDTAAELFRSADLLVRRVGARGGLCFVTFGSYTNEATLERAGFAEEFLRDEGIDAIHVINRDNSWYQYREIGEALRAVRSATAPYDRVITYGSSMGGYAALRFGRLSRADTGIAISPQFSLDPRVVPFEDRWQADVARITFNERSYAPLPRQYIFYDPRMALDRAHFDAFVAAGGDPIGVAIPYAGHPVGPILLETGVLKEAIRAIANASFAPHELQRQVRARRRLSQHHFFMLARRAKDRRPKLAIAFLRRAAAIQPESHIVSELAAALDRQGEHEEAGPLHRAAIERVPDNTRAHINYARHLEAIGRRREAAETLRRAIQGQAGSVRLIVRIVQFRMALRRWRLGPVDRMFEKAVDRLRLSPRYGRTIRFLGHAMR